MSSDNNDRQPLDTYGDEVLCAIWPPLVRTLAGPLARVLRPALDAREAGDFLARLHVRRS